MKLHLARPAPGAERDAGWMLGRGSWIGNKRSVVGKIDDIPHDSLWNPMIKALSYYNYNYDI